MKRTGRYKHYFKAEMPNERTAIDVDADVYAWLAECGFTTHSLKLVRSTTSVAIRDRFKQMYDSRANGYSYVVEVSLGDEAAVAFKLKYM
ncbi:hypothetical protein AB4Y36_29650 [Paraburkholderia sp. BR10936]|uniref:hypothetical protein n=1 Tax=Paraburkholderia sp. BR10936 TaxID=3236993 RepID=UPI0034D25776